MTDKLFYKLWNDALEQPDKDMYIGEYGYPDYFNEISADVSEVVSILEQIHKTAHMSVRDIISFTGLSQAAFAIKFCIPLRTVEDWANSRRKCPDYLRLLICRQLGIISI